MAQGPKIVDLTGRRFGRLEVLSLSHKQKKSTSSKVGGSILFWRYRCDCGNEGVASGGNLKTGQTQSCGCLHKERFAYSTHRMSNHPAYQNWMAMTRRCRDKNLLGYVNYGARGIRVCALWMEFSRFWEDM